MENRFFITGTDTGVGKTTFSCLLLHRLKKINYSTAALKPIASGATKTNKGLRSQDALDLQEAITTCWDYEDINPFIFEDPVSPHIASVKSNVDLTVQEVVLACQPVLSSDADIILIEGAGGWFAPINQQETMADLAKEFNFPVILTVGLKLGCINHSLLTYQAILDSGLNLAGWVANCLDPSMLCIDENISYLKDKMNVPLLGVIPVFENIANAIQKVDDYFMMDDGFACCFDN